jgi:hypothetical protein
MWKLASRVMEAKMSWTTSWVPVYSLPWALCKKWIPIGLMGYVHAHQGTPTIEECGSQIMCEAMGKKMEKINERLGRLVQP